MTEMKEMFGLGSSYTHMKEVWVDKYRPRSSAELAVHKKKVISFSIFILIEGLQFNDLIAVFIWMVA